LGAPGVDGMTVEELKGYLEAHWPKHKREQLLRPHLIDTDKEISSRVGVTRRS